MYYAALILYDRTSLILSVIVGFPHSTYFLSRRANVSLMK
jgi:hypothetical protein